ncbi:Uncharacterized protein NEOC65_001750 [Neochlamydia sp. AcF65]|uniref:gamma-glutamyl-gamma-aminobutyrate hydrolase family protein n=1 Tax=Neochlamydia sp. AcF65 TaxID=2795735 RepID=UPI001BC976C1|nr:gamma-glutamyl-gamma-aminobutyrate hydrolase family protein [Neochlamydia sp. AcF65]MBS4166658.1 Uncharacterized protein [Neochlamydia sp. AcF65]
MSNINREDINKNQYLQLLREIKDRRKNDPACSINFTDYLKKGNFSLEVASLDLKEIGITVNPIEGMGLKPYWGTDILTHVDFNRITFKNCNFEYINLTGSLFKDCCFINCNLHHAGGLKIKMINTSFEGCTMREMCLDGSSLNNIKFSNCDLKYADFYESNLKSVDFNSSILIGSNFLEVEIDESRSCNFINCELTDCLLFDAKHKFNRIGGKKYEVTKPIILLPWNFYQPGLTATKVNLAIKKVDGIPIKYNYLMNNVNLLLLDRQVKNQIRLIQKNASLCTSIPEQILNEIRDDQLKQIENSEIYKIYLIAVKLSSYVDAIILPGGADLEPEFYGDKKGPHTHTDSDYRRSLLEFALVQQAIIKDIPLMGICRGAHVGNVFYGGTLKQHIEGQVSRQIYHTEELSVDQSHSLLRKVVNCKFSSISAHHQALDRIGDNLKEIIVYPNEKEEIPKALENDGGGSPKIFLQFHPEYFVDAERKVEAAAKVKISKENKKIFKSFLETVKLIKKRKKRVECIKEIVKEQLI